MIIEGRTFIISGGASGLGLATAHLLTAKGGYVSILDLPRTDQDALFTSFTSISNFSARVKFFPCDVTSSESISTAIAGTAEWIKQTHADLGGIIACAGISWPAKIIDRDGNPMDMSTSKKVINVNVFGTLDLIRLALPHLVTVPPHGPDGERGAVIMVASSAAFDGQPGQVSYAASKGAIRSATLPMARDLARYGVRVVSIAPSLFDTNMTKGMGGKVRDSLVRVMEWPKRAGRGEEFAHLVGAVVENPMMNGECIRLDGAVRMPSKM